MTKKRTSLLFAGLLFSGLLAGISLTSCEKETIVNQNRQTTAQPEPNRLHQPGGAAVMGSKCGADVGCGTYASVTPAPMYNMLYFTKNAVTIADFPSLQYTIYKYASGPTAGVTNYSKIAEFTCTGTNMTYANATLTNSTSFYVVLSAPSGPAMPGTATYNTSTGFSLANAFQFTTGNYLGQYCGTPPGES